ncbi:hypothetical protein J6590_011464 [Homalodisca vitripennis]|nr:hypothetical protein J6590_011464 [Homalodisca vitripennis]
MGLESGGGDGLPGVSPADCLRQGTPGIVYTLWTSPPRRPILSGRGAGVINIQRLVSDQSVVHGTGLQLLSTIPQLNNL